MENYCIRVRPNGLYVVIISAVSLTFPAVMSSNVTSSASSSLQSSFGMYTRSYVASAPTSPFTNGVSIDSSSLSSSSYSSLVTSSMTSSVSKPSSSVSKKSHVHNETVEGKVVICVLLGIAGVCLILLAAHVVMTIVSLLSLGFTEPGRQRHPELHLTFRKASIVSICYL